MERNSILTVYVPAYIIDALEVYGGGNKSRGFRSLMEDARVGDVLAEKVSGFMAKNMEQSAAKAAKRAEDLRVSNRIIQNMTVVCVCGATKVGSRCGQCPSRDVDAEATQIMRESRLALESAQKEYDYVCACGAVKVGSDCKECPSKEYDIDATDAWRADNQRP